MRQRLPDTSFNLLCSFDLLSPAPMTAIILITQQAAKAHTPSFSRGVFLKTRAMFDVPHEYERSRSHPTTQEGNGPQWRPLRRRIDRNIYDPSRLPCWYLKFKAGSPCNHTCPNETGAAARLCRRSSAKRSRMMSTYLFVRPSSLPTLYPSFSLS